MKLNSYQEVKDLTKRLVNIKSVNKEPLGETAVARDVQNWYMDLPYFKAHPDYVKCFKSKDDFVDRHSTLAYVKGTKGTSNKTVILIGHIDTVGIDDFGSIKEFACDPDNLPEKLKTFKLSDEVLRDMESGEFMFGRGTLDMKSGVASHMYLIKYFSEHPEELDGNIIAVAECDEEDNSKGIITALDYLAELKEKEGFEYISCFNSDYSTDRVPGDENRYVYYGSVGKLLPCFVAFGKEAHVGQPFGALDPNLLLAEVTRNMSLNVSMCDIHLGEVAVPPISLKQADTKVGYTVQTALCAMAYYNYFTHGTSPDEMLKRCVKIGEKSFDSVIKMLDEQYKEFCKVSDMKYSKLPWETKVLTWDEFYNKLSEENGEEFVKHIDKFKSELKEEDLRYYSLRVIEEAFLWSKDKSPVLVLFYGSIYSAPIKMSKESEKERELLEAVEAAVEVVRPDAKRTIETRMFYPYISDSSFMAIGDTREAIDNMQANMPSYPIKYNYDYDIIEKINVPVVNVGSFGRDGHMLTERVDMWHTFQNVPNIIYEAVVRLLG